MRRAGGRPAKDPSEKAAPRAKTWSGVVPEYTEDDTRRVRAITAKRLAMRTIGTELHVFVVLADQVSAATLGRRIGIVASWEKGDGSSAHWQSIRSTHIVVHDGTHQGRQLPFPASQQPLSMAAPAPSPSPLALREEPRGPSEEWDAAPSEGWDLARAIAEYELTPLRATREPYALFDSVPVPVPPALSPPVPLTPPRIMAESGVLPEEVAANGGGEKLEAGDILEWDVEWRPEEFRSEPPGFRRASEALTKRRKSSSSAAHSQPRMKMPESARIDLDWGGFMRREALLGGLEKPPKHNYQNAWMEDQYRRGSPLDLVPLYSHLHSHLRPA